MAFTPEAQGASPVAQSVSSSAERRPPRLFLTFILRVALWAYVAVIFGKYGIYKPMNQHGVDYPKHWYAAQAIVEGTSPYEGKPFLWLGYNYPQWNAMLSFWLAYFDIETSEKIWKIIGLLFVIGCWWLTYRFFKPDLSGATLLSPLRREIAQTLHDNWLLASAVIVAAFSPAGASSLFLGQTDPINAYLAMAMAAAFLIGRDRLSGVYWAMLCLVKSIPVFLLIPIIFWRRWRILQGWLLFMAGYALVLFLTGRIQYEWFFVSDVSHLIPFRWRGISITIPRAIMLLFFPSQWHETPAIYESFVQVGLISGLIGIVATVWVAHRRQVNFERALEISLLFLPFLTPLLENHHFVWVMPALLFQIRRWMRGEMSAAAAAVLALGWSIVMLDYFAYNLLAHKGMISKFFSMPGGLLLLIASAVEILRLPRKPSAAAAASSIESSSAELARAN
jgi:hypothetical protein